MFPPTPVPIELYKNRGGAGSRERRRARRLAEGKTGGVREAERKAQKLQKAQTPQNAPKPVAAMASFEGDAGNTAGAAGAAGATGAADAADASKVGDLRVSTGHRIKAEHIVKGGRVSVLHGNTWYDCTIVSVVGAGESIEVFFDEDGTTDTIKKKRYDRRRACTTRYNFIFNMQCVGATRIYTEI